MTEGQELAVVEGQIVAEPIQPLTLFGTADPVEVLDRAAKGPRRYEMTDAIRAKIAAGLRGKKLSAETRKKISLAGRGRVLSAETRAKISAAHVGVSRPSPKRGVWLTDTPAYLTRHQRVRTTRGKASNYLCVNCGNQACDWSQIHLTSGLFMEDYEPRCRGCHNRYDRNLGVA